MMKGERQYFGIFINCCQLVPSLGEQKPIIRSQVLQRGQGVLG